MEPALILAGALLVSLPVLIYAADWLVRAFAERSALKNRVIRTRHKDAQRWRYVSPIGALLPNPNKAERLTSNEASRRILQYLNEYPGWVFEETEAPDREKAMSFEECETVCDESKGSLIGGLPRPDEK